jgi:hypothetical protein
MAALLTQEPARFTPRTALPEPVEECRRKPVPFGVAAKSGSLHAYEDAESVAAAPQQNRSVSGDVMTSLQPQECFAMAHSGPVLRLPRSVNTSVAGSRFEEPNQQPNWDPEEEWQNRLRSLQHWICELLINNQQLRMSLELATSGARNERGDHNLQTNCGSHTSLSKTAVKRSVLINPLRPQPIPALKPRRPTQ